MFGIPPGNTCHNELSCEGTCHPKQESAQLESLDKERPAPLATVRAGIRHEYLGWMPELLPCNTCRVAIPHQSSQVFPTVPNRPSAARRTWGHRVPDRQKARDQPGVSLAPRGPGVVPAAQ